MKCWTISTQSGLVCYNQGRPWGGKLNGDSWVRILLGQDTRTLKYCGGALPSNLERGGRDLSRGKAQRKAENPIWKTDSEHQSTHYLYLKI